MGLEVKGLSYSYSRDRLVLDDVSFKIADGKCVGIIGKNGVGKTTLMKCIIKLLKVDSNKIFLDGVDINSMSIKERSRLISYVPQLITLPDSTVFDSVLIGRLPYMNIDASKNDLLEVESILNELGLNDLAFKNVNNLSGGQRQKVAIARALVQNPRLLYLDEPTSNLDLKNQIDVLRTIKAAALKSNRLALINIQDINLALRYLDEIIILKDSRILFHDSSKNLTSDVLKEAFNVDLDIVNVDNNKIIIINEEL